MLKYAENRLFSIPGQRRTEPQEHQLLAFLFAMQLQSCSHAFTNFMKLVKLNIIQFDKTH